MMCCRAVIGLAMYHVANCVVTSNDHVVSFVSLLAVSSPLPLSPDMNSVNVVRNGRYW